MEASEFTRYSPRDIPGDAQAYKGGGVGSGSGWGDGVGAGDGFSSGSGNG